VSEQPAEHLARIRRQYPLRKARHVDEGFGFEATRQRCGEWDLTLAGLEGKIRAAGKSGRFGLLPGDRVGLTSLTDDCWAFALTGTADPMTPRAPGSQFPPGRGRAADLPGRSRTCESLSA
jgi:hypothetical protein